MHPSSHNLAQNIHQTTCPKTYFHFYSTYNRVTAQHILALSTTTLKPHPAMDGKLFLEMYKGRYGDRRCFICGWFGHLAYNCRNRELVAAREKRGDKNKNRWKVLRSCIMRYRVEHIAHPTKGNAQQEKKY